MPPSPDHARIEYLDWLRAIAVSLVVLGHSTRNMAPGGAVGVSVFFVLSGYLITSILLRDGMLTPLNIVKFIARRVARIWPMYAAVIVFMLLVTNWLNPTTHEVWVKAAVDLMTFRGLTSEWIGYTAGVLWSLYVEFWFYVTFPLLLAIAVYLRIVWPALCIGIALSTYARWAGYGDLAYVYYDHLLIGAAAAYAQKTGSVPSFVKRPGMADIAILTILALGLLVPFWHRDIIWWVQSLLVCAATAVAILAFGERPPKLSIPAWSYLGRISYSVYFIHAVVLDLIFKSDDGNPKQIPLYLLLTVLLSSATYFAIEEPINKLARRVLPFATRQERSCAPSG